MSETATAEDLGARGALAQWLGVVLSGEVSAPLPGGRWPPGLSFAMRRARDASTGYGERESERVRLFVNAPGGIPAPPYGSWWMERRLEGETTAAVADFYRHESLRVEPGNGAADYLPAELEFIHFLLQHQRAARMTGEDRLELQAAGREREFLDRFVLPWLRPFRSAVTSATADPFWLAWADLCEAFVFDEAGRVGAGPPAA